MDIGTIFLGIVCLVIAWAMWTYLPHPLGLIGGLIFGLLGIYFLLVGVVGDLHDIGGGGKHNGVLLPFLFWPMLRRRRFADAAL